ncbi:hypothetical protein LRS40_19365 [Leclercia sp. G3L]|uniref:phage head spike fiber domain-containing protein n=1 Tax=Leclercia sp. G3L TaxID=2898725 RepID=UPI001E4D7C42|nr:hypothetical protein [Leclercia sp. G3L]UGB01800.1 hypothetical protein LRS40_19365 [Leclercia sp. G3L]
MAILDDDLANAVTEGFRQAQIDIVNQDLILSGTGDVTVTLANGSKKTGPSWSKLITAANAAGTSATAAKTSETNALASKNAAATSATNAATSEGNALASKNAAKTSETNAKTSETNAKTSENNAGASASSAAASLAAAQQLTSVPYEDAPYPDVWAPLSDDLRLLAGFAPYDTLTISGKVLELPSKSMTFVRSTSATYIDKSGMLQTASINEPRFERGGLLVEGQGTNYFLNSDDASKWSSSSSLTKTVIAADGTTQAATCKGVINTAVNVSNFGLSTNISAITGGFITVSCRVKGNYGLLRLAFMQDGTATSVAFFDVITGALSGSAPTNVTINTSLGSDGYALISATLTVPVTATYAVYLSVAKAAADSVIPVGSEYYVQMPQVEKAPIATSYIPTGSAAATRTSDFLALQPSGNIGYRTIGDRFNRTTAFEIAINKYFMPTAGYADLVQAIGVANDIILRAHPTSLISYIGSSGATISVTYPFPAKVYAQTIDTTNTTTIYFDGKSNARMIDPTTPGGIPTSLRISGNPSIVYHIRNFRIWHRVLTDNQIKGLR